MRKADSKTERFKESLAEAEDLINSIGAGLFKLGRGMADGDINPEVLNGVFRAAHTIKGTADIMGFKELAALSHSLEDVLDLLRFGKVPLDEDVFSSLMSAHELLSKLLSSKAGAGLAREIEAVGQKLTDCAARKEAKAGEGIDKGIDKELLSVLTEYEAHRLEHNIASGKNIFIVTVVFPVSSFDRDYALVADMLKKESEVVATLPSAGSNGESISFNIIIGTGKDAGSVTRLIESTGENWLVGCRALGKAGASVRESSTETAGQTQPSLTAKPPVQPQMTMRRLSNTVRVNITKLDNIMNIISELGIVKSDIETLGAALKNERAFSAYGLEISKAQRTLERKLNELRDSVLDVRMVKIGALFARYEPFVEKLSRETGKQVKMITNGGETELDKLIVEELADPLMHIIRNAVDHAIEAPGVRKALGKDAEGAIVLSAYQKGNHVVVEVKDDGAGIDEEAVREKAAQKGVHTRDFIRGLSRQEALDLVFMPGLSTREEAGETSGRGVGMDVVKENISRLGGVIDIETLKGRGTRILLTIPITLAIIQALIVEDAGVRYAVPLNSVVEIIEFQGRFLDQMSSLELLALEDKGVPRVRLRDFFGRGASHGVNPAVCYGIVAGLAEHRVCVIVERLVEEQDIVIKPLPRIARSPGVAGATDMGDKGTLLVLDMTGILEHSKMDRRPVASA